MLKNGESNFYRTPDNEQLFFSKNFQEPDHSKPILVFNYGLVCSNHHWRYQLSYFEDKGYQILIHDYRGHFQSSGSHEVSKITFTQIALDTAGLCDYLGIKKAVFLGHSMGVNICLQIAKDKPELVRGMVLISGTFMSVKDVMFDSNLMEFVTPMLEAFKNKYPTILNKIWSSGGLNPLVKGIIHATGFNKDKVSKEFIEIYLNRVGQLGPDVFFQLFSEMTKQNIVSSLERMKMPALIIGGHHDNVIPNHLQRTLAGILPNAESYYLYAGSHVPQADYPELVNERIDLFIRQNT
jgi:pimeloyl-ACP methyl ester carboxylesterase